MSTNGITYDTLASNETVETPPNMDITITRNDFEIHVDAFNDLKNYINITVRPTIDSWSTHMASITAHMNTTYPQSYAGVIPLHLDADNLELFARRVHQHERVDISDFSHTHPINDVTGLRIELDDKAAKTHVPSANASVTDGNDHDARYISRPELRKVGLFESAFVCANGVAYNFDEFVSQGNWLFGSDMSHVKAPPFKKGMLSVVCTKTGVAANNDIYQIFYADNGNTYRRSYARINGQTSRSWSSWERVNGPYRIK